MVLQVAVGGKVFSAEQKRAQVSSRDGRHGGDKVALVLQGRLEGNTIVECGLVAQVKLPRAQ